MGKWFTKIKTTKLLGRHLTEIVVIFIGITISFMFDGWRENVSRAQTQEEFVQSLISDLKFKAEEMESESKSASSFCLNAERLFQSIQNNEKISNARIENLLSSYNSDNNFFQSSTPTFNSSAASEQFQQLPDSLRRKIFEMYSAFEYIKLTFELVASARYDFKKVMTSKNISFSLDVRKPDKTEIVLPNWAVLENFVKSKDFSNNLRLCRGYESQKIEIMNDVSSRLQRLITSLSMYLKSF